MNTGQPNNSLHAQLNLFKRLERPKRWKGGSTEANRRCYLKYGRERYYTDHKENLARRKKYRDNLRKQVLDAYGNKCNCCGETEPQFLALDHISGKPIGVKQRSYRRTGTGLYKQARDAGFPSSYQLLCHNCNGAKGYYGVCPHKKRR